ncbi:MAG: hypothetical protein ACLSBD_00805 [Blautia massiliensis (ex Durand et al. 2017)]
MAIADSKIIAGSTDSQVSTDWLINRRAKYYLAAKKMMDIYDCNAFSTACHELCTTEIPQNRKFTPCMCHSIMKDEGIPSGCEEDLNALMAMLIMQYAGKRPAFMGNPNHETDELLRIHHAVPALQMNGYGTKPLAYKLWAFTGQGFGGKLQVDFTENDDDYITLGRFNPAGDTTCIKERPKVVRFLEYADTALQSRFPTTIQIGRCKKNSCTIFAGFGRLSGVARSSVITLKMSQEDCKNYELPYILEG